MKTKKVITAHTHLSKKVKLVKTKTKLPFLYDYKDTIKALKLLESKNKPVTSIIVDEYIDITDILTPKFAVSVIYGRKKTERARFPHLFDKRKIAIEMYKELQPTIGTPFIKYIDHPLVVSVCHKFAPLASNYKNKGKKK